MHTHRDGHTSEIAVLLKGKVVDTFLYRPSWLPTYVAGVAGAQTNAPSAADAGRHCAFLASYSSDPSAHQHLGRDDVAKLVRHLAALQVLRDYGLYYTMLVFTILCNTILYYTMLVFTTLC
jgi:hypothetical protein